jgi:two-component system chemotaxis response regulator CheY
MLLVTQDADRLFANELGSCLQQQTSTCCIVLKLSRILQKPDDWPARMAETIGDCLRSDGQIYFHDNDDVTVLVRNATRKDFTRLVGLISTRLAPASLQGLAFLYELPMAGEIVAKLFTRAQEAMMEPVDTLERTPDTTDDRLNPNLVRTIGLRRKKRKVPNILIVEDDTFLQRLVGDLFTKSFSVKGTQCGADAIDFYIQQAPDVVLLDIGLPDMGGLDILARILELDPDAYIVMLSGQGNRNNVLQAMEHGAKGFVGKPFTPTKLFSYTNKCPFIQEKTEKGNNR